LFVTWYKNGKLWGCIGTFQEDLLSKNLPKYAAIAAFGDWWFSPINISEFEDLEVSVSLLTNFEQIKDPLDWIVGTHGIEIEFTKDGRVYRGTYLPNVASE